MGGTVKSFEDLRAWQEGRKLVNTIYALTNSTAFRKDLALRDQIRRAAISILLNIAEGFARDTDKEFRHYLIQSRGSVAEMQSALYIALDQQYMLQSKFEEMYCAAESLGKMLTKLINYLSKASSYRKKESSLTTDQQTTD